MSTKVKPNQLDKITKKGEIPEDQLPKEINKSEDKLYHVLAIEKTVDFEEDKVVYKTRVVKYNEKSYQTSKDLLTKSGFHKVVVLHDPTAKKAEPKEPTAAEIVKQIEQAKSLEEIKKYADHSAESVKKAFEKKSKELTANNK